MKYLFSYFLGNEPDEERVCLALSEDGYHFKPLNGNKPVIVQTTGTKCCRDPFIIRDINGGFYMIATDMKSSDGWCSNHGVVSWHSDDLINWTDETAVDFHIYPETENADKIWAPEALYDKSRGERRNHRPHRFGQIHRCRLVPGLGRLCGGRGPHLPPCAGPRHGLL